MPTPREHLMKHDFLAHCDRLEEAREKYGYDCVFDDWYEPSGYFSRGSGKWVEIRRPRREED